MVAADPHVPGPGRSRPTPKNVATSVAQSGADGWEEIAGGASAPWSGIRSLAGVMLWRRRPQWLQAPANLKLLAGIRCVIFFQRFTYIRNRRRDHIGPTRPFTQIGQAAALAAEGKLRILATHRLFAGGATQVGSALASHERYTIFATRS